MPPSPAPQGRISRVENCRQEAQEYGYPYEDSLFLNHFQTADQAVYAVQTDNSGGLESITTPLGHTVTLGIRPTLGVFSLYVRAPWATATYQLDATGRLLSRHVGNHVTEFLVPAEDWPAAGTRRWKTKTMELKQELRLDAARWWVNQTLTDKFTGRVFISSYGISTDGSMIRNAQSLSSGAAPHVNYTCRKSTKDLRVDCDGTLFSQPISYSVTFDRTNQLPSSVNGFEVITGIQTMVYRHPARGLQVLI